jgi:hypothetical protein
MTEQLLHGPNIVPVLQQMRGEGVPQRVGARRFIQARAPDGGFDCSLNHGFVEVVASRWPPFLIAADPPRWKDELPRPFCRRIRVLSTQRVGQDGAAKACREIARV